MKKDVLVVITIILFILGSGYGVYVFLNGGEVSTAPRANEGTPTVSQLEDAYIEVPVATERSENGSDPTLGFTYRIVYPEIALVGHPKEAKETNTVIKTFATDILDAFKRDIAEIGGERGEASDTSDLTMLGKATLLSPTIISLRFDISEYVAGSAHPNSYTRVFNYDIEERRLLGMDDVFTESATALQFLSEYARETLRDKFSDLSTEEWEGSVLTGTEPTTENFSRIALKQDGLLLIFNPYQVASYARGTQEIFVPTDAVAHLLSLRTKDAIRLSATNFVSASAEIPLQMQD